MAGRGLWQKLFLYWATQRVISWTTSGDDDKRGRGERKEGQYQQAEIEGYVQERTHGVLRDLLLNISLYGEDELHEQVEEDENEG